jgi:hypothetical protein
MKSAPNYGGFESCMFEGLERGPDREPKTGSAGGNNEPFMDHIASFRHLKRSEMS